VKHAAKFAVETSESAFSTTDGAPHSNEPLSPEEEEHRSKKQTRQAATQNPTIRQVLRALGGEIVDIKMQ
jgi:hypothetical protein